MSHTTYTPRDDFPPHGYLDNPYHRWKLNPSGVLRSRPPAGMGWHVPNYGSYGRNQFEYRAHLHVGLAVAGRRLLTPTEFGAAGVAVTCDIHTKNRLRYVLAHPGGVRLAATFLLVDEHTLGCRIELLTDGRRPNAGDAERTRRSQSENETQRAPRCAKSRKGEKPPDVASPTRFSSSLCPLRPVANSAFFLSSAPSVPSAPSASASALSALNASAPPIWLWLAQEIAHNPATSRLWEHGLYTVLPGASEPVTGEIGLVGVCPEGNAWAHGAALAGVLLQPSAAIAERSPWPTDTTGAPLPSGREPQGLQTATLLLAYDLTLPPDGIPLVVEAALARGVGPDQALAHLRSALAGGVGTACDLRMAEDERFWEGAPQLAGDWPDSWRRGFVTDLETLRMVARPPAGVFHSRWDGMQIQAPRIVLAEAVLDALALGWADLALARELLLTCFTSAPRPNVPCMREDGSYNMIADDGAICGTGLEWGWPFAAIEALVRRSGDSAWLESVYPGAASYMDWWLTQRVDQEGWLVHACSWESGQDVSRRFGEQSTGGSDVRHLRPVDLQAAAAQACALLAGWAAALARPAHEVDSWQARAEQLTAHTREMWRDGWFHDFDTRAGRWSDVRDPMQLAPLACGLATDAQIAALRPAFDALPPHADAYPPLVWPPVAHTALEAALAAGMDGRAAELAAAMLERVWRRMDGMIDGMDVRELEPDGAIAGVTREYWPEAGADTPLPSAGIEGYGWGALTVHVLIRYLVGLREVSPARLRLAPAIPVAWRRAGARFVAGPLAYGTGSLTVTYSAPSTGDQDSDQDAVEIQLAMARMPGVWVARDESDGRELARADAKSADTLHLAWRGLWLQPALVERT